VAHWSGSSGGSLVGSSGGSLVGSSGGSLVGSSGGSLVREQWWLIGSDTRL
jgi:hypothetical protein